MVGKQLLASRIFAFSEIRPSERSERAIPRSMTGGVGFLLNKNTELKIIEKMDKLEEIRRRKLSELRAAQLEKIQQQAKEQEELQQQVQQLESIVKQALTKDALQRYSNLKTAFPERAVQLLIILAQAIQSGQISKIGDNTLKEILKKISPEKKDIKIKRS